MTGNGWCGTSASAEPCPALVDGFQVRPWAEYDTPAFVAAWRKLACRSRTPNPFHENWFLLPSLRQFDRSGDVRLATLVHDGDLLGMVPLWQSRNYHGRSLPHLAGWTHPNSFCGEPLIAEGNEEAVWSAVLDWCDRNWRQSAFLHFAALPLDGTAFETLNTVCQQNRRPMRIVQRTSRAALHRGLAPEDHLVRTLGKKRRKELARKRRRLEDMGELVFTRAFGSENLDHWIDQFLALENAGWKGLAGSSLASAAQTADFFRQSLRGAASEGRLERLAFHLDGKAVAMLCNFITPPLAHSFKTAFDESLSKLSPGMLLQVENLALLERDDIALTDSCAVAGHPMIEQIWDDRRDVVAVSLAIGGGIRRRVGDVLTAIESRRSEKRT
ncbi:GNAT family N-acetyltransferase [Qipengyuania sp. 6D47A]|uniref:GNAT family N-acetyltransferase n=1 Tax=Qipengyuania qiaonensis TaxID=2867240 RepID=A0ABS7J720_9SPHN|nr:GNAT family N-acetyltransferase [Qipengyuania qiaonensis]